MFGSRVAITCAICIITGLVFAGCRQGSEAFPTQTATPPPYTIDIPDPFGTQEPYAKRRDAVFPVNLLVPISDGSIWTTVRREGDPKTDAKLDFIVEGYVEAREDFAFDYDVDIVDAQDNIYPTSPGLTLGNLATGDKRKFEVRAQLPSGATITQLVFKREDRRIEGQVGYHVDLAIERLPTTRVMPPGYEDAR